MKKIPLLVICGPTASGKTALSLSVARSFPLEIISADSRQVYRGMDIGTAKVTAAEQAEAPHHLIDLIDPDDEFSVAEFVARSRPLIQAIHERGRLPCVVGGTGLYIKALLFGLADLPQGNADLRRELRQREAEEGRGTLYRELQQLDPMAATRIHPHNLVRIIRALEVYRLSGQRLSAIQAEHDFADSSYRFLQLAPEQPRNELYAAIDRRSQHMIDLGLIDEVRTLLSRYPHDLKAFQTLGYREVMRYLGRELSLTELVDDISKETRRYAKRQLTWFRRQKEIIWVDSLSNSGRVLKYIVNFIFQ